MFTAMPKLVMPDGKLPALNDATRGRTLDESLLGLVAARYAFDDPSLDGIIDAIGERMNWKVDLQVFMYYVPPTGETSEWKYPENSVHMPGTGLTALRRGGQYALLKYNPYSGGHDHPDKLSIIYYAGGRELFPSRGTIQYGHPLYRDWYRKTEAHNTVMVDGQQQHKAECEALDFIDGDSATGVSVACRGISDGVTLARTIILIGEEFVDIFFARSYEVHKYDWFLHANALAPEEIKALGEETPNPEMEFNSTSDIGEGETKTIKWIPKDEGAPEMFTMLIPGIPGRIYEGVATGFYPNEKLPALMWRQEGKRALFLAVTSGIDPEVEGFIGEENLEVRLKVGILKINMNTGKIKVLKPKVKDRMEE